MKDFHALSGEESQEAVLWLERAAEIARNSRCCRRRCGSILISPAGDILATGENGLPGAPGQSAVHCQPYALSSAFKSDKSCCIHAEQRAVMAALASGKDLKGSVMIFTSVDENGDRLPSGRPYCTICSKMALDAGVGSWILEHEREIVLYEASAYNRISFEYNGN
jgi:deoxycytidylate deaminase